VTLPDEAPATLDLTIALPDGTPLPGHAPVVIIGPNGSGKTRQAREIRSPAGMPIAFVNALRNTRVTTEIPAMGLTNARSNLNIQGNQARSQFWELVNDFDVLLARLHAEDAAAAIAYRDASRRGTAVVVPPSSMERVQILWARLFPGRELGWNDNIPMVQSIVGGAAASYQGHFMSDGEKAGLYLMGKVMVAEPGILVVDEPETHFHTLLAVEVWNELEKARRDVRLVYVTHDLTFGLSRAAATFVVASPTEPMRVLEGLDDLPSEAAEALLGAASFSFYARRLIFCEGVLDGIDHDFYRAWFTDLYTVVRPLGSCEMVIRAVELLRQSDLLRSIEPHGIIDRDFHSDEMLGTLPVGVTPLPLHEVESLYCLPGVVASVARHVGRAFDEVAYVARVRAALTDLQRHGVIIERWKRRVEGPLLGLVGQVASRTTDLDATIRDLPSVFDQSLWPFSPSNVLLAEKQLVEGSVPGGQIEEILRLMPGKSLISLASISVGMNKDNYRRLVNRALAGDEGLEQLAAAVAAELTRSCQAARRNE
jgi:hypothetical protein